METKRNRNIHPIYKNISHDLLLWYREHARSFPWRLKKPNPYFTWISEIMLQQTTTTTVIPYFIKFTQKWPTLYDFSHASEEDVLKKWEGLGYYRRARMLHKAAKEIIKKHDGEIPSDLKDLLALPGIGNYTASAIRAIAFNKPASVMDGNVERVFSRLFKILTPLPQAKKEIHQHLEQTLPSHDFGDYAQALMDLGATICTPKNPNCTQCPLTHLCQGQDIAEDLPVKPAKKQKPHKHGFLLYITTNDTHTEDQKPPSASPDILICKRPSNGLLGNLYFLPSSFTEKNLHKIKKHLSPHKIIDDTNNQTITHTFTHFKLSLTLYTFSVPSQYKEDIIHALTQTPKNTRLEPCDFYTWIKKDDIKNYTFPRLIHKAFDVYHS